jgi:hypothetical protein
MKYGLTESEQRGYLTCTWGNGTTDYDVPGWYKLTTTQYGHIGVARRKIGGRNWSYFGLLSCVDSFELYDAAAEKFARELAVIVARTRAAN